MQHLCEVKKFQLPFRAYPSRIILKVTMTSSNENIFRDTGLLWGESIGHRWIPLKWCGALKFFLICAWTNGWSNNQDAGDLRRHQHETRLLWLHCNCYVLVRKIVTYVNIFSTMWYLVSTQIEIIHTLVYIPLTCKLRIFLTEGQQKWLSFLWHTLNKYLVKEFIPIGNKITSL